MPPVHSTLAEITGFLERHPPFSALTPDALEALAVTAEIEYFPAGSEILVHEGPPAEHLFVVRRGAVELVDEGTVVDVLEEGESFGHPSLLSGLPPVFTVRAREDTLCLLFPAEATVTALADPEGVRYLASTLTVRLERASSRGALPPWGTGRVRGRARPAVTCPAESSIREAALRMTESGEPWIVVPMPGGGHGMVTDHDLRARVVTGEISADAPISTLLGAEALTTSADRPAFEVLADMLRTGVEQAVVVGDEGELVGVVDHSTLLDLGRRSPLAVRRDIERARDTTDVAAAAERIPHVAVGLLDSSAAVLDVLSTLSSLADAVARRLTELALDDLGEPPAPWVWLSLGSEARREQTLATDQDNGLAYDGAGPELDEFFARFADRMNLSLEECGYASCRAGVMARNPGWRLPRSEWISLFEMWLLPPTRRDVHMAMIGLDLREVTGPLRIQADLDEILATAPSHPLFLERLAQTALETRPPLGFLREFVVERTGEHVGTLDLKEVGTGPIVSFARRAALAAGSTATSTVDRLRAAAAREGIAGDTAAELEEAFVAICRMRLEHQAAQVERGQTPDNHVDPRELAPLARRQLKEAFRAVARAQRTLDARVATRIP
jgi:CBS domain-containing protein